MKRRRRPPQGPNPQDVHDQMLEHLDKNPPPRRKTEEKPKRRAPAPSQKKVQDPAPTRPRLMLRKLRLALALERLEAFVRQHRTLGTREIVVVVGKGIRSGEDGPVIGPEVRRWCNTRPALVADWRVAPPSEGGDGALVLTLTPKD